MNATLRGLEDFGGPSYADNTEYPATCTASRMKARKLRMLQAAKRSGLFEVARRRSSSGVRILNYHGIWNGHDAFAGDSMFMNLATFERRLEIIRTHGYPVISLDDAVEGLAGQRALPPNAVVITIDDGWYSTCRYMIPILVRLGMPATLYCDTAHIGQASPIPHVMALYLRKLARKETASAALTNQSADAICEIATDRGRPFSVRLDATVKLASLLHIDFDRYVEGRTFHYMSRRELSETASQPGISVELHTHNHTLHDMSRKAITEEIDLNRRALSDILGHPADDFRHFCYPSGVFSAATADIVASLGIKSAATHSPRVAFPGTSLFTLPRFCDNEHLTELEFEAELSGLADWLRRTKDWLPGQGARAQFPELATLGTAALI